MERRGSAAQQAQDQKPTSIARSSQDLGNLGHATLAIHVLTLGRGLIGAVEPTGARRPIDAKTLRIHGCRGTRSTSAFSSCHATSMFEEIQRRTATERGIGAVHDFAAAHVAIAVPRLKLTQLHQECSVRVLGQRGRVPRPRHELWDNDHDRPPLYIPMNQADGECGGGPRRTGAGMGSTEPRKCRRRSRVQRKLHGLSTRYRGAATEFSIG